MRFSSAKLTGVLSVALTAIASTLVACGGSGDTGTPTVALGTPTVSSPPSPTPIPEDFVATITLDADPSTPAIDHRPIEAKVGDTFEVAVVVQAPPEPYQAYQFGLYWQEPVLKFVEEKKLKPEGLTLCPNLVFLEQTTGIYSGCINVNGAEIFEGQVSTVALQCQQPGRAAVRLLSLVEVPDFGVALLREGGEYFATDVDRGLSVTCS